MNPSVAAFTPNHVSKLTYTVAVQQKAETEWTEIVQIEVPLPKSYNSILVLAGKYKDDPDFDDVVAAIHEYTKQVDAD